MQSYRDFISSPDRDCAVVAHRGAWADAPENSLAAIEAAIDGGFDVVELDVRRSADNELFVLHDPDLARMAGLAVAGEDLTIRELVATPLRDRDGRGGAESMTAHTVPTLSEAFVCMRGRIYADLDLKDPALVRDVIACAKAAGVADQVDVKANVGSQSDIGELREGGWLDGVAFMPMMRFAADTVDALLPLLREIPPFMCESKFDALETLAANRAAFEDACVALWVNTLDQVGCGDWTDEAALADPDAIWGRLLDAGVSAIQTDRPVELKRYLAMR